MNQISNHSGYWITAGLTYLSITGSRNTIQGVRDLAWSRIAWMALRRWGKIPWAL
jgi:hypothetical protein